jgi:hypothetical protein
MDKFCHKRQSKGVTKVIYQHPLRHFPMRMHQCVTPVSLIPAALAAQRGDISTHRRAARADRIPVAPIYHNRGRDITVGNGTLIGVPGATRPFGR